MTGFVVAQEQSSTRWLPLDQSSQRVFMASSGFSQPSFHQYGKTLPALDALGAVLHVKYPSSNCE